MITLSPRFNPAIEPYRVDIAQAVSKYVGETEKNLNKAFDKVDSKGNSLYFDEADSLFGKRTSVQDAADRYQSLAGPVRPGTDVSLNPQPLPPKALSFRPSSLLRRKGDQVSLNPQPLPPKEYSFKAAATQFRPGAEVSLNPQPLPPRQNPVERLYRW